jgi:hypothetical protein
VSNRDEETSVWHEKETAKTQFAENYVYKFDGKVRDDENP